MLSAAEVAMHQAAKDDAAWQKQRQEIYAPPGPKGPSRRSTGKTTSGTRGGLTRSGAAALVASMDAEDARLTGRK